MIFMSVSFMIEEDKVLKQFETYFVADVGDRVTFIGDDDCFYSGIVKHRAIHYEGNMIGSPTVFLQLEETEG